MKLREPKKGWATPAHTTLVLEVAAPAAGAVLEAVRGIAGVLSASREWLAPTL